MRSSIIMIMVLVLVLVYLIITKRRDTYRRTPPPPPPPPAYVQPIIKTKSSYFPGVNITSCKAGYTFIGNQCWSNCPTGSYQVEYNTCGTCSGQYSKYQDRLCYKP